jgi:hypothetical protein
MLVVLRVKENPPSLWGIFCFDGMGGINRIGGKEFVD